MSKLVSPINGIVDAVEIKTGQITSPGFSGIRVVNSSNLKVIGEVSESYSAVVQKGDKVKIYFPDLEKEIESNVTFTSKVINPQSRTFTVESKLGNDPLYKPNMIAVIRIADYEKSDAILVDVNMIQRSSDGEYVYVAADENGKKVAKRQVVTVGEIYGGKAEITSGLKPGDRVINTGYQDLIAGQVIEF